MIGSASSQNIYNLSSVNSPVESQTQNSVLNNITKKNETDSITDFLSLLNNQPSPVSEKQEQSLDFLNMLDVNGNTRSDVKDGNKLLAEVHNQLTKSGSESALNQLEKNNSEKLLSKIMNPSADGEVLQLQRGKKDVLDSLNGADKQSEKVSHVKDLIKQKSQDMQTGFDTNFAQKRISSGVESNKIHSEDHLNILKMFKESGVNNKEADGLVSRNEMLNSNTEYYGKMSDLISQDQLQSNTKEDGQPAKEISNSIAHKIHDAVKNNLLSNISNNNVQFDITHKDLGTLNILVKRNNKNIEIKIVADQLDAKNFLMANKDMMQSHLMSRGVNVSSLMVEATNSAQNALFSSLDDSSFKQNSFSKNENSSHQQSMEQGNSRQNAHDENGREKRNELWQILKDQRELIHA